MHAAQARTSRIWARRSLLPGSVGIQLSRCDVATRTLTGPSAPNKRVAHAIKRLLWLRCWDVVERTRLKFEQVPEHP